MTNKILSITDLLNEQVEKDTLVGRLYGKMLYLPGKLFRITLFKGADYFRDDMTGSENYHWSEASEKVEDKFGPGAEFAGYNGGAIPHEINRITLLMGWNPWTPGDSGLPNKKGYLITLPKDSEYREGRNCALGFYQNAIHSVEVMRGTSISDKIMNPKAR